MKLKPIIIAALLFSTFISAKADKLEALRTSKKIILMDKAVPPYYAIQIIALKRPPQAPEFFKNVEVAREYVCSDGYHRFCIGQYNSYAEAKKDLDAARVEYDQAFIVNTARFELKDEVVNEVSEGKITIDPNKIYTIQLSALRYPVYLSHFKDLENVMEFRMKDKIFRYTVGEFKGDVAKEELEKIKALGYKDANIVELEKYLPYKIE